MRLLCAAAPGSNSRAGSRRIERGRASDRRASQQRNRGNPRLSRSRRDDPSRRLGGKRKTTMTAVQPSVTDLDREMRAIASAAREAAGVLARAPAAQKTAALQYARRRCVRRELRFWLPTLRIWRPPKRRAFPVRCSIGCCSTKSGSMRWRPGSKRWLRCRIRSAPNSPAGRDRTASTIARVRIPIGVIGIIYESRPNVTADAGGLCLRAGNAVILRGGSESFASSGAIAAALRSGIAQAGLPEDAVQLVPTARSRGRRDHAGLADAIDVIVPRGGRSLIERGAARQQDPGDRAPRGPLPHLRGCGGRSCQEPGGDAQWKNAAHRGVRCDRNAAGRSRGCGNDTLAPILADLHAAGCEIRGDAETQALDPLARPASEEDWTTEYLDAILSVRVVDGLAGAIAHINHYGSHHTDTIVTENAVAADRFLSEVESAIVLHNASTQFADGGEFGMGAEIGISTGRLPPRGPVGRRAAHQLQVPRARHRPNPPLSVYVDVDALTEALEGVDRERRDADRLDHELGGGVLNGSDRRERDSLVGDIGRWCWGGDSGCHFPTGLLGGSERGQSSARQAPSPGCRPGACVKKRKAWAKPPLQYIDETGTKH